MKSRFAVEGARWVAGCPPSRAPLANQLTGWHTVPTILRGGEQTSP